MRYILLLFIAIVFPYNVVHADVLPRVKPAFTRPAEVHVWKDLSLIKSFNVSDHTAAGGAYLAVGTFDASPEQRVVVGAGARQQPFVRVYDLEGHLLHSFLAYPKTFQGGVRVAVGDIDGDGVNEIVTTPGPGYEAHVKIFHVDGSLVGIKDFLAYDRFTGGVHLTVGDTDNDGQAEIITAPGPGGGPDVRVWNGKDGTRKKQFFAFDQSMTDGVTVAFARTPEGPSILTAVESWSMPVVRRIAMMPEPYIASSFLGDAEGSRSGLSVASADVDRDGYDEVLVSSNGGVTSTITTFDIYGTQISRRLGLDPNYVGAVSLAALSVTDTLLLISPAPSVVTGPIDQEKSIEVNLSEQRLYAYEHGRVAKTFLISSGTRSHPTPVGKTTVKKKIPIMDYAWNYGAGNPSNYFLPNVRYNLNIFPHIYIHSAYWHHNFGHVMSHGCINTSLADAQWIYDWSVVGTPVETKK